MRSWSVMAMTSSVPAVGDVVEDGVDARRAVRGDRVDVQVGAAGRSGRRRSRRLGVTPRPPRGRARSGRRPPTTAPARPRRSARTRPRAPVIVAVTRSRRDAVARAPRRARADRGSGPTPMRRTPTTYGRRAALDGEHRRSERQVGRCPEERHEHPAAGQVAVADEADRRPVAERGEQLAARLAQPDDADARRAAGPHEVGLERRRRRWSPSARRRRRPGRRGRAPGSRSSRSGGRRR